MQSRDEAGKMNLKQASVSETCCSRQPKPAPSDLRCHLRLRRILSRHSNSLRRLDPCFSCFFRLFCSNHSLVMLSSRRGFHVTSMSCLAIRLATSPASRQPLVKRRHKIGRHDANGTTTSRSSSPGQSSCSLLFRALRNPPGSMRGIPLQPNHRRDSRSTSHN
ncbi:uncharacterized protein HMPREF1120_08404 [Exophiala dermatitidis NIH/UT8656]|uniref:Uncharacterized protein n=1 Tax=Exophiala dermatitidis (strain ATCC 34100 / CBS 525.76 / NIH/UT8656) TaxID=858893 RepID=H6C8L5_EXODN|nr:uncharacterized protein HMPREF1120_08404 [Exophiala dermatitidis NIH/UT8656]EHY60442.1 hypothetical protein HMPREF1120_08404 [Exophiala dermatitidis NIH/UT8656]